MSKVLAPFLFFAISLGLFFTYIDPAYKGIQALQAQQMRLDQALTKAKEHREIREALAVQYMTISEKDRLRLLKLLPDSIDNVRLVIDIDTIASTYGLRVRNFTFTEIQPVLSATDAAPVEQLLGTAQLSFSVIASHADFTALLHDLESSLRIVDVISIDVKTKPTKDAANSTDEEGYQYTVTLNSYWLR